MNLEHASGTTTAFYTLDSCNGEFAELIANAIEEYDNGNRQNWTELISENPSIKERFCDQGISQPSDRKSIIWDNVMILFTGSVHVNEYGKPMSFGDGITKERFGRFPWGDGSVISYLKQFMKSNVRNDSEDNPNFTEIMSLLSKLNSFNTINNYDFPKYVNGNGGLNILGFLTFEEVISLRRLLSGRNWSVSSEEPLDGGVRDGVKHLSSLLKAAERRDSGVMLRSHN